MMFGESPESTFDGLVICKSLSEVAGGATEHEIALFAYLACLLSVYDGQPSSQWGYKFAATKTQAPFSTDLANSVNSLRYSGLVEDSKDGLCITSRGLDEIALLGGLQRFRLRLRYLSASCNSALAIPLPIAGASIGKEPELKAAIELSGTRPLIDGDGAGSAVIHQHFRALAEAFPEKADLFAPAVVWLTFLGKSLATVDLAPPRREDSMEPPYENRG